MANAASEREGAREIKGGDYGDNASIIRRYVRIYSERAIVRMYHTKVENDSHFSILEFPIREMISGG